MVHEYYYLISIVKIIKIICFVSKIHSVSNLTSKYFQPFDNFESRFINLKKNNTSNTKTNRDCCKRGQYTFDNRVKISLLHRSLYRILFGGYRIFC